MNDWFKHALQGYMQAAILCGKRIPTKAATLEARADILTLVQRARTCGIIATDLGPYDIGKALWHTRNGTPCFLHLDANNIAAAMGPRYIQHVAGRFWQFTTTKD